ncbi:putative flavin-binding monooxygenase-like protein [Ramicandelaber brevisporus]|nr:putative flavin-binding monooxygenase-like protein [Ramicandelaber brevisporus]
MAALRVCVVGAGPSGICAAIQLKRLQLDVDITIFEADSELGGSWAHNYPGLSVDIASHLYSFSFELNPNWSSLYAPQDEIQAYLLHCAHKYDIYRSIQFETKVATAHFDNDSREWIVTTATSAAVEQMHRFDIVISAVGILRRPSIPSIFDPFTGTKFHAAHYDHSVDLNDKHVAVIGTGSTTVQLVPAIVDRVSHLSVFQRSATHIIPRKQYKYSQVAQWIFRVFPSAMMLYRWSWYLFQELGWWVFVRGSYLSKILDKAASDHLHKSLLSASADQTKIAELRDKLQPQHEIGCKRLILSSDYYQSLTHRSAELVSLPVTKVTADSIETSDGKVYQPDVVIFATGYQTIDTLAPMHVTSSFSNSGNNNSSSSSNNISRRTYYGMMTDDAPNFFMVYGVNSNISHNSVIFIMECQTMFIAKCIAKLIRERQQTGEKKVIVATRQAIDRFTSTTQQNIQSKMAWSRGCGNWYRSEHDGRIATQYSNTATRFWWDTLSVSSNDIRFV